MKPISMVDLKSQHLKIKDQINSAIDQVIESTAFINGPVVKSFQENLEKYLGVKHVIPCANGTDALQIAMMALDLKPGDEVITTTFTFIATAEVIALLKLKPVLVDVYPDTYNINVEEVSKAITPKTKAIIPVHLFGQCADMERILEIAQKHDLFIIEDACQSIGADYIFRDGTKRKSGTIGHVGCTSFFPSKNLGCYGDGGAIFTNNDELANQLRTIANHGMKVRYYHDFIGVNSRLDSIQAAILNVKLQNLDQYIKARQTAAEYYDSAFANISRIKLPTRSSFTTHVFHQYTIVIPDIDRHALIEYLASKGIPAMVYYPVPLHNQKAYKTFGFNGLEFPVADFLSNSVISLPMHTELDTEQLNHISSSVIDFLK